MQRLLTKLEKTNIAKLSRLATASTKSEKETYGQQYDRAFHVTMQTSQARIDFNDRKRDELTNSNLATMEFYFSAWNGDHLFEKEVDELVLSNTDLSEYDDADSTQLKGTQFIANLIASNPKIKKIDLSNAGLVQSDAELLLQAVRKNNRLIELNLQGNDQVPLEIKAKIEKIIQENASQIKNKRSLLIDLKKNIWRLNNLDKFNTGHEIRNFINLNRKRFIYELERIVVYEIERKNDVDDAAIIPFLIQTNSLLVSLLDFSHAIDFQRLLNDYQNAILKMKATSFALDYYFGKTLDYLLTVAINSLYELKISKLTDEINRVPVISDEDNGDRKKQRDAFISSLRETRELIRKDVDVLLYDQPRCHNEMISDPPSLLFAESTRNSLSQLKYTADSVEEDKQVLETYGKTYKEQCINEPRLLNFGKAVFSIIFTGISFLGLGVLGALVGLAGCGIGAIPGFGYGAYKGLELGHSKSKEWMGMKHESVGRYLFFQPSIIPGSGKKVTEKGVEFITSRPKL